MTVETILDAARHTINNSQYAMLVTHDEAGTPYARLIDPFPPEDDFTVWMGTHPRTRKVAQLAAQPRCLLTFQDIHDVGYVALSGTAVRVDDEPLRMRYWKPAWWDFYPDGPTGAHFCVLMFRPVRIELINYSLKVGDHPTAFKPAALAFDGERWLIDDTIGVPDDDQA